MWRDNKLVCLSASSSIVPVPLPCSLWWSQWIIVWVAGLHGIPLFLASKVKRYNFIRGFVHTDCRAGGGLRLHYTWLHSHLDEVQVIAVCFPDRITDRQPKTDMLLHFWDTSRNISSSNGTSDNVTKGSEPGLKKAELSSTVDQSVPTSCYRATVPTPIYNPVSELQMKTFSANEFLQCWFSSLDSF